MRADQTRTSTNTSSTTTHRVTSAEEAVEIAEILATKFSEGAAVRDRERRLPWEEIEQYSASGLWAMTVPKEYGGAGVGFRTLVDVVSTISAADPCLGQLPQNHFAIVHNLTLTASGTQKKLFLPQIVAGCRFGNAFSEIGGKTAKSINTTIQFHGDTAELNGERFYCTGAIFAHYIPVLAVDELRRSFIAIIPKTAKGINIIDNWAGFGQRTTASGSVQLRNVVVPQVNVILAWKAYVKPSIDGPVAQIIHAAVDLGIARGAFKEAVRYSRSSRPWVDSGVDQGSDDPLSQMQVGELAWRLESASAMLDYAADSLDKISMSPNEEDVALASIAVGSAKILTSELALLISEKLIELGGARCLSGELGLDRFWRNARAHTVHDPIRWKYHMIGNHTINRVNPPRHSWN